jgi:hypothetical protein
MDDSPNPIYYVVGLNNSRPPLRLKQVFRYRISVHNENGTLDEKLTRLWTKEAVMTTSAIMEAINQVNAGQCNSGFLANTRTTTTVCASHMAPPVTKKQLLIVTHTDGTTHPPKPQKRIQL